MIYKTKGTCSTSIDVELKDGVIDSVKFTGGCNGNLQGISALVKGMKPEVHKQYTGVDNTRILENIKKLSFEKDTRIWIRMPLVEGVNASENDIDDFLAFYLQLGSIDRIDLLPYHSYGTYKAKSLQMPEEVFETPSPEKMERIRMKIKMVNENVFVM